MMTAKEIAEVCLAWDDPTKELEWLDAKGWIPLKNNNLHRMISRIYCGYTFRVKPTPQPKVKRPWTADDVPPVCWVKARFVGDGEWSIDAIEPAAILFGGTWTRYTALQEKFLYSTDRKTWHVPEVEE